MRIMMLAVAILSSACGSSPSGPTPVQPSRITVTGNITDTVSGAVLGSFTQEVAALPALVSVSAPGHHTRLARITAAQPTVDLIPDAAPFDLTFYRQLVRSGLDSPSSLQPLRVLTQSPRIYLQRTGLSDETVAALEQAARAFVPALSGGRLQVASWETGDAARPAGGGGIVIDLINDSARSCGESFVGESAGHIWLNQKSSCTRPLHHTFGHELGHALGFRHVDDTAALMMATRPLSHNGLPSDRERYHAAIAYARRSGNGDVDQDTLTSAVLAPMIISD